MFGKTSFPSPQTLQIPNFWKGGDFMGLVEADPVTRMISEGGPVKCVEDPCSKNSSFPERKGRIRFDSALELVETVVENG